ncbi:hypothetical protein [Streptomyces sp. NPDC047014]|uniref:hypothetical protein n=1 Tax=Streptomyces sp. NPDC047014 TaxID=3155736 RepID=UPI0033C48820
MTMMKPHRTPAAPTAAELRRHVETARKGLGRTVGKLASKAGDVAAKAQSNAPDKDRLARLTNRMLDRAAHPGRPAWRRNLVPLRTGAGRVARTAKTHRTAVITAASVLTAAVLARRSRRVSVRVTRR